MVSVPICIETDSLACVWQVLQQTHCDQIVVLNQQQQPQGVLSLSRLMFVLPQASDATLALSLSQLQASGESAPLRSQPSKRPESKASPSKSSRAKSAHSSESAQPLDNLLLDNLLEPIAPLPQTWTTEQFQPHLPEIERQQWSLVDDAGRYLGLVDRLRLLQAIALTPSPNPNPKAKRPKADSPALGLDPLIDLLERLPIPLMLQTATGQLITQNLSWRQQLGELRNPDQISQEAGIILATADSSLSFGASASSLQGSTVHETSRDRAFSTSVQTRSNPTPANPSQSDPDWPNQARMQQTWTEHAAPDGYSSIWENSAQPNGTMRSVGSCLGTEPDTCICICPMKNGQDRVWQFIKIPMGTIASLTPLESAASAETAEGAFKLASLEFSPDPTWRSLVHSEQLWLVLAQDTTDQQQIVKELAAKNADLVQLNRLKDEFLACISHELKTPLTAVLGLSSLLKDHSLGNLNERQSRYAKLIHQSGRHLISIVNNILDLTRIETGQMELNPGLVRIEQVCLQAYQQALQLQAAEENSPEPEPLVGSVLGDVEFSLTIQPGLENLIADELRLRQMLSNLLSNALKFTEAGGKLGLKIEAWEGWLAFTVWDTGIGIPVDKQHLIFQKFQQLESPLTRQFKGTGLGLVLTQRLARLHGGDVTFTSIEGEGSEFTLLLPPRPPQGFELDPDQLEEQRIKPVPITARNRLVLIVESTPQLLDSLTRQLVGLGYRVAIARSGMEAIEKIRRLQPCVVFLNPVLPMLSGWDVLTLLKADGETRHIPVVAMAMRIDKKRSFQNGANAFLSLPIQTDALQRCVDRLVAPLQEPRSIQLNLTVLHLQESSYSGSEPIQPPVVAQDLTGLLHPHHCRVLEVDDLDQADLLARVWKPDVVLLGAVCADPITYIERFSQSPFLSTLPIVTLTTEMTQAANQVPGLAVFPCLNAIMSQPVQFDSPEIMALLQVMQMAVGIRWTPQIMIADLS
ncbi:MAG: hybrid sensor histidine kinase/response regulator, partial [Oculatellaceae cyanobacterium Prado106]|nr:hybrid sensor histidine kinase/response regulator [Oculatellaceae cyanobacterium Prado106]